jgi:hypothetical protein
MNDLTIPVLRRLGVNEQEIFERFNKLKYPFGVTARYESCMCTLYGRPDGSVLTKRTLECKGMFRLVCIELTSCDGREKFYRCIISAYHNEAFRILNKIDFFNNIVMDPFVQFKVDLYKHFDHVKISNMKTSVKGIRSATMKFTKGDRKILFYVIYPRGGENFRVVFQESDSGGYGVPYEYTYPGTYKDILPHIYKLVVPSKFSVC